jgi:hypothetical protein
MHLLLNLTEQELRKLRQRTSVSDDADAVSRAAREYLRACEARELTAMAANLDYDENAWRDLDKAELSQPEINIDRDGRADG